MLRVAMALNSVAPRSQEHPKWDVLGSSQEHDTPVLGGVRVEPSQLPPAVVLFPFSGGLSSSCTHPAILPLHSTRCGVVNLWHVC